MESRLRTFLQEGSTDVAILRATLPVGENMSDSLKMLRTMHDHVLSLQLTHERHLHHVISLKFCLFVPRSEVLSLMSMMEYSLSL